MSHIKPNHLANETSPYLLQHAENPVEWYPWRDEALTRARAEDKPILLSIGYSACHWCHVMAHESFENKETARLMNEHFINIKVDREERPDLDTVYMEAVQSITGGGGWPLTVFLTPEGKPFYGGTYFPPEDRHGLPGFPRVLMTVSDAYKNRNNQVKQATDQILKVLNSKVNSKTTAGQLTADILEQAYSAIKQDFDRENGGFGGAPKFPQPIVLEFLLRYHLRTREKDALEMVTSTLEKMARGGIYDQIGGGFHRYSTDNHWLVPHFEKMLYDNALLSKIYLHAYLVTKTPLFRRIAEETIDYVLREMTSPQGGFYSTQDADSEGEEGKYYLWSIDEIKNVLGDETAGIIGKYYGVTTGGNFESRNILHVTRNAQPEEPGTISQAKALLLKEREKRIKPGRDEKISASWNGLMLSSLAQAATILRRRDYLDAAVANGSFLLGSMTANGYLMHTHKDDQAKIDGFLEDYALVIEGLLDLHQVTFQGKWLKEAISLTDIMVNEFWDESAGMFYDTGKRHQPLFIRPQNTHDGAIPSGPSSATLTLLKVNWLTGNDYLWEIARKSLESIGEDLSQYPLAFGNWLCALDLHLSNPQEIAIIGP
ncbi:MAG: thioredoxin domain-containing protein, partial [Chloroflexota bacterium]